MKGKIILVVLCVLVLTGCICAFFYFTGDRKEEEISVEPIFTLENIPTIDASTATHNLANALIANFTGKEVPEDIEYTTTHPAYVKLINGEVDLIIVTEPSEEELELAKGKNIELEVIPVVREGFVFFVNEENPVKSLTIEQIQKIYSGEIKNWKDVNGNDKEIKAYQRPPNSGSQTGMLSLVMKDKKMMNALTENIAQSMADIINLVSDYDNAENAIGYSYYYYARTMYEDIDSAVANSIRLLGVDGIAPSVETIKNGEYKLQTSYYIVVNKNNEDSNVRKFINEALSERGQKVAEEAGYVGIK